MRSISSGVLAIIADAWYIDTCIEEVGIRYATHITQATDYSAFGAPLSGRSWYSNEYRYGFNGKENNNQISHDGDYLDYGDRVYDARIGRWLKMDTFHKLLAGWSGYRFGLDNPITYSDREGNFEIDEATKKAYPKLDALLKNMLTLYEQKPEEFKEIYKGMSQMTDKQIKEMLTYGKGPKIFIDDLGSIPAIGLTSYDPKTKQTIIKLDINYMNAWRDNDSYIGEQAFTELFEITVFHEGVHYGDRLDGKTNEERKFTTKSGKGWKYEGGDLGDAWETIVYGSPQQLEGLWEKAQKTMPKLVEKDKLRQELKNKIKSQIRIKQYQELNKYFNSQGTQVAVPDKTAVNKTPKTKKP